MRQRLCLRIVPVCLGVNSVREEVRNCAVRGLCSSTATREEAEILQVICTVPGCIFEEMGTSSSAVIGPHCLNLISLCAIQSGAS